MITYSSRQKLAAFLYVSRKSCKLNRDKAAEILGVGHHAIGSLENSNTLPSERLVNEIAEIYHIGESKLLVYYLSAKQEIEDSKKAVHSALRKGKNVKIQIFDYFPGEIASGAENRRMNRRKNRYWE